MEFIVSKPISFFCNVSIGRCVALGSLITLLLFFCLFFHQERSVQPFITYDQEKVQPAIPRDKKHLLPQLASYHMFGIYRSPTEVVELKAVSNYTVQGIFMGPEEVRSAVVATVANKDRVVTKGERLADGSILHAIEERRIVVKKQGRLEAIPLQGFAALFG